MGIGSIALNPRGLHRAAWKSRYQWASWLLAGACLWWALRGLDPAGLVERVRAMDWRWALAVVLLDLLGYVLQGLRWQMILRPLARISLFQTTEAIYAGLFVNEMLPLRAGEALRTWLVARRARRSLLDIGATIVAERVMDGVWLALALVVAPHWTPLPGVIAQAVRALTVLMAAAVAVLLLAQRFSRGALVLPASVREAAAWLVSGAMLATQGLAFWAAARAFGLGLALPASVAVLLVVRLGTLIPGAPANAGTFQFACVLGLGMFSISGQSAAAFSLVVFALLTVPLWALGAAAFAHSGARSFSLQGQNG